MTEGKVWLYLDDVRPVPDGWMLATNIEEAKAILLTGEVVAASLDHDLGACDACMGGRSWEEWVVNHGMQGDSIVAMPHCTHVGTGYDLVCWMEETGNWPKQKPVVHSANPVGRARMLQAIEKAFPK
jgi:hypothetical protein